MSDSKYGAGEDVRTAEGTANGEQEIRRTRPASGTGGGRLRCCRRRASNTFKQTMVILRHSERRDYVDPSWKESEEGLAWPHDAPITEEGIKLADEVAAELLQLHQKAQFSSIACSPYRRCLETAARVAKVLDLPVVIDQEIGEVRDRDMPKEHISHRTKGELNDLVKALDLRVVNPVLEEDGGLKIFGKTPVWPETLDQAKDRYVVRMETYIRKGAEEHQNIILVTHADAVAAALVMFERGGADVQNMSFCARVIANRDIKQDRKGHDPEKGVFAEQWIVQCKAMGAETFKTEGCMAKYYEKMYLEKCEETQVMVANRNAARTKTDMHFDKALLNLQGSKKNGDKTRTGDDEAA